MTLLDRLFNLASAVKFSTRKNLFVCVPFLLFSITGHAEPFVAGLNAMDREHYATAFRAWKGLAETGEAEAQNNLGYLYQYGYGAKQSYTRAIRFYTLAADQGLAEAHHNLGMLYFNGYGSPQNYDRAKRSFLKAAEKELGASEYMLGLIYYQGLGLMQNYRRAKSYFIKAAKNGNVMGQFMLSFMLQVGEGHPDKEPEPLKAFIWSSIAIENGYIEADSVLSFAKMQLTDALQRKASAVANTCKESDYEISCPS